MTAGLCQNDGGCVNTIGDYQCNCKTGFRGKNCSVNIDDCEKKPCINGQCKDEIADYTCNCYLGYEGKKLVTNQFFL